MPTTRTACSTAGRRRRRRVGGRALVEARRHLRGELLLKPEDPAILLSLGNLLLDSGDIGFGTPSPGVIAFSGETDEWTFFGRAGRFNNSGDDLARGDPHRAEGSQKGP